MDTAEKPRSLREWTGGGTADEPAPAPQPYAGPWWRVAYHPVGNKLTVALMEGDGPRARVLAMQETELGASDNVMDQELLRIKETLLARHQQAQLLIIRHSGPCDPPSR